MSDGFIAVSHSKRSQGHHSRGGHRYHDHSRAPTGSSTFHPHSKTTQSSTNPEPTDTTIGSYSTNPFAYLTQVNSSGNLSEDDHDIIQQKTEELEVNSHYSSDEDFDHLRHDLGPGPHPLSHEWTFWYLKPPTGGKSNQLNYESLLKQIGSFNTVKDFWSIYLRLKRPEELTSQGTTDYSMFRSDIRPVWEDPNNADGGKLMIRIKKGGIVSARLWEILILSLVGNELPSHLSDEICGVVFSIRSYEDIISIWTRHSQDMTIIQELRELLRKLFQLNASNLLEYKPHHYSKEPNPKDSITNTDGQPDI